MVIVIDQRPDHHALTERALVYAGYMARTVSDWEEARALSFEARLDAVVIANATSKTPLRRTLDEIRSDLDAGCVSIVVLGAPDIGLEKIARAAGATFIPMGDLDWTALCAALSRLVCV